LQTPGHEGIELSFGWCAYSARVVRDELFDPGIGRPSRRVE